MVDVVRVKAKVVQDDSGVFTEIPILLDENKTPIKPLVEYMLKLKRDGLSQSTMNNSIKATQLLLEYMNANTSGFSNPQTLFETFCSRLYTGTIGDDGLDPSGLYWLPLSRSVARLHINSLSKITDWLAEKHGAISMNPLVKADSQTQRLNYAAWYRRTQNNFLGHIKDSHINSTSRYARSVQGKSPLGKQIQDAIEFPENLFEDFYFHGLGGASDHRVAIRDQLILILMHGGGLRESEALHLWFEDVLVDPVNPSSVKVRIYHPEDGKAPNKWRSKTGKTTRAAYLKEVYALSPRNTLLGKNRVGWKCRTADSRDEYLDVHWFPSAFGEVFAKLWNVYSRLTACVPRNHPYAFVSFFHGSIGQPYTLNAFNNSYSQGLKRIGLTGSKQDGLSPHSHRHSYGRRLRRAGVHEVVIKKCLHHSSIMSQAVYTTATANEITSNLNDAMYRLSSTNDSSQEQGENVPSWDAILEKGFEDIDPNGLFSGKKLLIGKTNG